MSWWNSTNPAIRLAPGVGGNKRLETLKGLRHGILSYFDHRQNYL